MIPVDHRPVWVKDTAMSKTAFSATIITLFPELFPGFLGHSLTGKALEKGLWSIDTVNPRDFTTDVHKTVDDTPFGGGAGMVMKPDVLSKALQSCTPHGKLVYMSPRGKPLTQARVEEFAQLEHMTILCGRYEGVDQRLLDAYEIEEVSIGDYILTGGEQAAMIMLDAVVRQLPEVLGNQGTHDEESFTHGLLEYPHYTRPAEWVDQNGTAHRVPDELLSGHHANIEKWRRQQAEALTKQRRPDLWEAYQSKKTLNRS